MESEAWDQISYIFVREKNIWDIWESLANVELFWEKIL